MEHILVNKVLGHSYKYSYTEKVRGDEETSLQPQRRPIYLIMGVEGGKKLYFVVEHAVPFTFGGKYCKRTFLDVISTLREEMRRLCGPLTSEIFGTTLPLSLDPSQVQTQE